MAKRTAVMHSLLQAKTRFISFRPSISILVEPKVPPHTKKALPFFKKECLTVLGPYNIPTLQQHSRISVTFLEISQRLVDGLLLVA